MQGKPPSTSDAVVQSIRQAFSENPKPATLQDVAELYAKLMLFTDAMVSVFGIAATADPVNKLAQVADFENLFRAIVDDISDSVKELVVRQKGGDDATT